MHCSYFEQRKNSNVSETEEEMKREEYPGMMKQECSDVDTDCIN